MIDRNLPPVPRLGRHPSRWRLAGTPVVTVMLGEFALVPRMAGPSLRCIRSFITLRGTSV